MPETAPLLPLVQKFFEKDIIGAARTLEAMSEEQVVEVPGSLPSTLAAKAVFQSRPM